MKSPTIKLLIFTVIINVVLFSLPAFAIVPPSDEEAAILRNDPRLQDKINRANSLLAPLLDTTSIQVTAVADRFGIDIADVFNRSADDPGFHNRYDISSDGVIDERDFAALRFETPGYSRHAATSPSHGQANCAVIPIKFPDVAPNPGHQSDYWSEMFFGDGTYTTKSYYTQVSEDQLTIGGSVLTNPDEPDGYWMADYPKTTYNFDMALLDEILTKVDDVYDFSDYDADSNTEADGVFFIYAGAVDGWGEFYWGWATYGDWTLDGTRVGPLMFVGEDLMSYRVAAHEFGHMMGLPDYYDYTFNSAGIGVWGLMGKGEAYQDARSKAKLDWREPIQVSMDMYNVVFTPRGLNSDSYRLWHMGEYGPEYYLVEMVAPLTYDYKMPGSGLIVWHVDETRSDNNTWQRKLLDVEEADGQDHLDKKTNDGDATDPYWLGNQDHFDSTTYPNTDSYEDGPTSVQITNISAVGDGTITADLLVGIPSNLETDEIEPNNAWNDSGVIPLPSPNSKPDGMVDAVTDPSDYWRVTVGKPAVIDIQLNSHNDGLDLSLYLWSLGGGGPLEVADTTYADEHLRAFVYAPGNHFIEVRSENGAAYYDLTVNWEVFQDPGLIEIKGVPVLPPVIYDNTKSVPALRLDILSNAGFSALKSLNLYTMGSTFPSIVENVELWLDNGDEVFGPGLDTLLKGGITPGPTNQIVIESLNKMIGGYSVIWVVVDIGDCETGGEFGIGVQSYKDIEFTAGDVVYDNFPALSGVATVVPSPMPLCYVAAGDFMMGSDSLTDPYYDPGCDYNQETPFHKNRTGNYYISQFEITNAQYKQFMDDGGYSTQSYWNPGGGWNWKADNSVTAPGYWNDPEQMIGDAWPDYPVGGCSWYESMAYATYVGGRLPHEAEWEKSGRGTDARIYTYGSSFDASKYSYAGPLPVGSFPASDSLYGVSDLCGNIYEWTLDAWASGMYESYSMGSFEPPSSGSYKMHRGYRYLLVGDCNIDYATRLSYRDTWSRATRWYINGFRVAFDSPE